MSSLKRFLVFIITPAIPHSAFKMKVSFCVTAVNTPETMFPNRFDPHVADLRAAEVAGRGRKGAPPVGYANLFSGHGGLGTSAWVGRTLWPESPLLGRDTYQQGISCLN